MRHTLPAGIVGPGFNDEFGDTFGIIYGFTADGFTHRELRDYVEDVRSKLLHVARCLQNRDPWRPGRDASSSNSRWRSSPASASTARLWSRRFRRRMSCSPAGTIQTGNETLSLRVSGAFRSEQDVRQRQFCGWRPHAAPQRHRRDPARLCRSAATFVSRQWQARHRLGHRDARRRRHSGARQEHQDSDRRGDGGPAARHQSRSWWPIRP